MDILKVDKKLIKQFKPDGIVKFYYKTPCKMCRLIGFTDGTWMHIETNDGFFDAMKSTNIKNIYLNVYEKHTDKQGRTIRLYTIETFRENILN